MKRFRAPERPYRVIRVVMRGIVLLALMAGGGCAKGGAPPRTASPSPVTSTFASPTSEAVPAPVASQPATEAGPPLDPSHLPLIAEGVAVELGQGVALVGIDGTVYGHLAGFTIDQEAAQLGAPAFVDQEGQRYSFAPAAGELRPLDALGIPLTEGAELVQHAGTDGDPPSWTVERAGIVLWEIAKGDVVSISDDLGVVTAQRWKDAKGLLVPLYSEAFVISTGEVVDLPGECWAGARSGAALYLVCHTLERLGGAIVERSFVDSLPAGGAAVQVAAGPPILSSGDPGAGFWRRLWLAPNSETLLLQWSGECEIPFAFEAPSAGGTVINITGDSDWTAAPESEALGWTSDGRAVAFLPQGLCGNGAEPSGIYLFPRPGTGSLLFQTAPDAVSAVFWSS